MAQEFKCEGYRTADATVRVSVREPGRSWSQPSNYTLTEIEVVALIKALNEALAQAYEASAE